MVTLHFDMIEYRSQTLNRNIYLIKSQEAGKRSHPNHDSSYNSIALAKLTWYNVFEDRVGPYRSRTLLKREFLAVNLGSVARSICA